MGAEVAKQIYCACAQPACELLLHTGEENIIQSACELFRKLLLVGGERLLNWAQGGPPQAIHVLVLARPPPVPRNGRHAVPPAIALCSALSYRRLLW